MIRVLITIIICLALSGCTTPIRKQYSGPELSTTQLSMIRTISWTTVDSNTVATAWVVSVNGKSLQNHNEKHIAVKPGNNSFVVRWNKIIKSPATIPTVYGTALIGSSRYFRASKDYVINYYLRPGHAYSIDLNRSLSTNHAVPDKLCLVEDVSKPERLHSLNNYHSKNTAVKCFNYSGNPNTDHSIGNTQIEK